MDSMTPAGTPDLAAIQALAAADMAGVDALIRRRLDSDVVLIQQIAEHIIAAGGKRLRPRCTCQSTHKKHICRCGHQCTQHYRQPGPMPKGAFTLICQEQDAQCCCCCALTLALSCTHSALGLREG